MKNKHYLVILLAIILSSCSTTAPLKKSVAYKGMYDEKPLSVLLMPPINRSTNVEAKEYFQNLESNTIFIKDDNNKDDKIDTFCT